jgi:hypothetical protein
MSTSPGFVLGRAAAWAAELHRHHVRKASGAPYLAHLIGTAGFAALVTDDEITLAAAMLHDAIEDQGATSADAREVFGRALAAEIWPVVELCSDSAGMVGRAPWRERKAAYLEKLSELPRHVNPITLRRVAVVSLADKTYNARAIEQELRTEGQVAFNRMSGRTEALHWYYPELVARLSAIADAVAMPALKAQVAVFAETVDRVRQIYDLIPAVPRNLSIARASDLVLGMERMMVPAPNGDAVPVGIHLRSLRAPAVDADLATARYSPAAEDPEFVSAISTTLQWVLTQHGQTGAGQRLPRRIAPALSATALMLEHGGTTAEVCATAVTSLARRNAQQLRALPELVAALPLRASRGVATLVPWTATRVERDRHGVPSAQTRQDTLRRAQARSASLSASIARVLAAEEVVRAQQLNESMYRAPLRDALDTSERQVLALRSFARSVNHYVEGSLPDLLTDVASRVYNYRWIAATLSKELAQDAYPRDRFTLRGVDGISYEVKVIWPSDMQRSAAVLQLPTAHPHPQLPQARGLA